MTKIVKITKKNDKKSNINQKYLSKNTVKSRLSVLFLCKTSELFKCKFLDVDRKYVLTLYVNKTSFHQNEEQFLNLGSFGKNSPWNIVHVWKWFKSYCFLMFSGGREKVHWGQMGWAIWKWNKMYWMILCCSQRYFQFKIIKPVRSFHLFCC